MSCSGNCHNHINFTTRGKLLLIDVEKAKRDEFNRRRKLRLQQVRQQSNVIAKEIRDKVKAEKVLKYSQEELKKEARYEKWKEVQIKTLQDEFNRRALVAEQDKENAIKEAELVELEKKRQQVLDDIAKKRGNLAVLKQRREKLNVETESFLKTSNAKFNRSLENLRSALIASLPKPDAKKGSSEQKPLLDQRLPSPNKFTSKLSEDGISEGTEDANSVIRIIRGDQHEKIPDSIGQSGRHTFASCQSSTISSSRYNALSPDRFPRPKSWSYSPVRRHLTDFPVSPRKLDGECWSSHSRDSDRPTRSSSSQLGTRGGPGFDRGTKPSFEQKVGVQRSGNQFSPSKRLASNILTSPSKRVAPSSQCSHSKDSSPTRCDEYYSPNKYRDELDCSDSNRMKSRHVRFENVNSLDESDHIRCPLGRSRTVSEGDSEGHSESDLTWPPRKWNKYQEEEVILYDHCGRTSFKYQPKHTVSLIRNQVDDNGLEEEMEACREKALRKHEETLRERRGCRAMYRQRLRSEFSCMMSDLANLDKQTRLAKLESDAKAALLPRKQKKKMSAASRSRTNTGDVEKDDSPGRVQVMDCVAPMDNESIDTKSNVEVIRQEEMMDCNLDALDQLLARLKEQRDHLLACQEASKEDSIEKMDKNIQSTSVQCSAPISIDSATSPIETSPIRQTKERVSPTKESRATSPIEPIMQELNSDNLENISSVSSELFVATIQKQSNNVQTPKSAEFAQTQTSPKLVRRKKKVEKTTLPDKDIVDSVMNDSKQISSLKISDESSSAVSLNNTSCSFDGVKVEVKVSKNKVKKAERKAKTQSVSLDETKNEKQITSETPKIDSWAKKFEERSSSTGTSFMSPPGELNPDEHRLLISVLEGIDKKNSNPILGMYIQRLLSMSKGSLDDLSVSVTDDSIRSGTFKTCNNNTAESSRTKEDISELSYMSAQSHEGPEQHGGSCSKPASKTESHIKGKQRPVKVIIESDEGSSTNHDTRAVSYRNGAHRAQEDLPAGSQFIDTLSQYNRRLNILAKMMTARLEPVEKEHSENETAYLAIPSDLNTSVKLTESAQEVGLSRPEESYDSEREEIFPNVALSDPSSWGIRSNLLPRPQSFSDRTVEKREKPPSTINNFTSRRMELDYLPPHELSTITEVDSKILSKQQHSTPTEPLTLITKSSSSQEDTKRSEENSYHTLPPPGFPISSESSLISSDNMSPIKPANESSLHILTELPDSSFEQSSTEEVAVSEVFRSLGIGWALSTWRKTHKASRKVEETSSSSPNDAVTLGKKKTDEMRCRHSTPIKTSDSEKNKNILDSDSNRLTPPSVTLYERYQNLICSASDSTSNDA